MSDHVTIDYTNWRGERRKRTIIPLLYLKEHARHG